MISSSTGATGSACCRLISCSTNWQEDNNEGTCVRHDERRVRPRPSVGIHAHPVDGAPTLEHDLTTVFLEGKTSKGETVLETAFLPHPLTYAMMKLFAFRDRVNDGSKEFGRYHALDLYTIIATTNETEWDSAKSLSEKHRTKAVFRESGRIIETSFSSLTCEGLLRLRESPYYRPEMPLDDFISILTELFPHVPEMEGD